MLDATLTRQREIMVEAAVRPETTDDSRGGLVSWSDVSTEPQATVVVQHLLPDVAVGIADFERGYRDFGGREEWLSIFVAMGSGQWMNPICPSGESRGLLVPWRYGDSYHYSALQFAPSSWTTASQHTGLGNAEDLYHVGANTAWWSNNTVPSEQWSCWP